MKHKSLFFGVLSTALMALSLSSCFDFLQNGKDSSNKDASDKSALTGNTVLTFTCDQNNDYPVYLRSTSFGDFDYSKKTFKAPDNYDSSLISDGSVNPLSFTAYKLKQMQEAGIIYSGFGFIDYEITYDNYGDYHPIPECAYSNEINEFVNSDAHYVIDPADNKLSVKAVYCPAFSATIDELTLVPFSGNVARDERIYYQYALQHYTAVPSVYADTLDTIISENNWYEEELTQVDRICAYVSNIGQYSLDEGNVSVSGNEQKQHDPVFGLIENGIGSDFDFNTVATLLFRRLNIPARLVKGYLTTNVKANQENAITLMNQHYWFEIYVKGTGWMLCDCANGDDIVGENPFA